MLTSELSDARHHLRVASGILDGFRSRPNEPRWLITQAEQRVLQAIDWVWQAQCRAVLDVEDEKMDEPWVRRFVNQVDWGASVPVVGISGIKGVIRVKKPA
jgi:hypothetical protein